jgi:peptidoglycan/LPS O-acetylase OafA/YrhL
VCRADALAAGSLIAMAVRRPRPLPGLRRIGFLLALSAAALIGGRMALWGWAPHETGTTTYGITLAVLLFVGMLLCALLGGPVSARIFNQPVLRRVGKYSYAMYVFHFMVFRGVAGATAHVHFPGAVDTPLVRGIVQFLLVSSLTYAVALGSWYGYEMWFLRLKERFRYRVPVNA